MSDKFACAVCISCPSESSKLDFYVSAKCGHIFHDCCIRLVYHRKKECPVCRQHVDLEDLRRLYGIDCNRKPNKMISGALKPEHGLMCDHLLKIVVLGDTDVGKSAFLRRYDEDLFDVNTASTIFADFRFKTVKVGSKSVKLHLWDTAGQERFRSVIPSHVRGAHAILFVYSITDMKSFLHIEEWMKFAHNNAPVNVVKVLVGNKCDVKSTRAVSVQRGKRYSERRDMSFYETSAKENMNIDAAIRATVAEVLAKADLVKHADQVVALSGCNRYKGNGSGRSSNSNCFRC